MARATASYDPMIRAKMLNSILADSAQYSPMLHDSGAYGDSAQAASYLAGPTDYGDLFRRRMMMDKAKVLIGSMANNKRMTRLSPYINFLIGKLQGKY